MSDGKRDRRARDHKYAEAVIAKPRVMVGLHGWHREVFPEEKVVRHGKAHQKPEREDRWQ